MKKNTSLVALLVSTLLLPSVSFAALGGVKSLLVTIKDLINLLFPILLGLGVIFFFWGMAQFILKDAGNDKAREDGKNKMLWGIIALFVMFAILGILKWIGNTLDIPTTIQNTTTSTGFGDGCVDGYDGSGKQC